MLEFFQIIELVIAICSCIYGGLTANKWKEINSTKQTFVVITIIAGITLAYRSTKSQGNDF